MSWGHIYGLKKLDSFFGPLAVKLCAIFGKQDLKSRFPPKKILVIRPGGIGDAVLLLPALNVLHNCFSQTEIYILAERRNAGIFEGISYLKKVFLYDRNLELFLAMKKKYDLVIDTEQWHRLSAVVAYLTRAPLRIGFSTNERTRLFTHPISYSHKDYEIFSFLRLLEPIMGKIEINIKRPFFSIKNSSIKLEKDTQWVAIFPGASIEERKWSKERFREIARWLNKNGIKVVVVGGKQDKKTADYIIEGLKGHINRAGKVSILETAQILSQTKLLLTTDSGIMHLSIAVGTPVVALFGPGIEEKWAPRDGKSIIINKHLPCSPCTKFGYTPPCPYDARCMQEISVNEVKEAINALLAKINAD